MIIFKKVTEHREDSVKRFLFKAEFVLMSVGDLQAPALTDAPLSVAQLGIRQGEMA